MLWSGDSRMRSSVFNALDSLLGWKSDGEWTGTVKQVVEKCRAQGAYATEYAARKVLKEVGSRAVGRGLWRVSRLGVFGC